MWRATCSRSAHDLLKVALQGKNNLARSREHRGTVIYVWIYFIFHAGVLKQSKNGHGIVLFWIQLASQRLLEV